MATRKTRKITLTDRLSRLTYTQACRLLGPRGKDLIQHGGRYDIDIEEHVSLSASLFRLTFPDSTAEVTIATANAKALRLGWRCSKCRKACEHVGAALSIILEEKMALGLAAPPPARTPVEILSEDELVNAALEERRKRARAEKMRLQSMDPRRCWTDYTVTNAESGKTYRVALRGEQEQGESYCSCPDFKKNRLGTCKHIIHVLAKVRRKFPAAVRRRSYRRKRISVHVRYAEAAELRILLPRKLDPAVERIVKPIRDRAITDVRGFVRRLGRIERLGHEVMIYPDAEEYIQQQLRQEHIGRVVEEIRVDPATHPLRNALLTAELLPYQLDGIAFAAGAGRALLADDMGLGKTIQGIGLAELLAREAGIERVLVISPASVKTQWRSEIRRFCDRDCQVVLGSAKSRVGQYERDCFFTVCNYEQVLRDILTIERVSWDLIILDEGQRIKNWEAKTSRIIKGLKSPYALVLSGTPLENRLDDLYSVVEFVDDRRLAPAFRFYNRHRVVDERGKVLGYRNLAQLRATLKPIVLRRTRDSVMRDLPPRMTEVVRITPTDEQLAMHSSHMIVVASIVNKRYISEMDLLRLQKALLMCRMTADSTVLVDKQKPGYSSKLDVLDDLLGRLSQEDGRKIVLFSEWTTMLGLIEAILERRKIGYVRLDGSVPQSKRQQLVHAFQTESACRVFITTNAGSTGLNLQAANTVINVDLPWNPAMLEQRIARAHRMGQKRTVQVFVLVTESTIEENLLSTLAAKHELALAALDPESEIDEVDLSSGMEELKRRLEVLLGAKPEAEVDESNKRATESEAQRLARRERVAAAGGQLLSAAFQLLGELLPPDQDTAASRHIASQLRASLAECVDHPKGARPTLTITLPDEAALDGLAASMARLLAANASPDRAQTTARE